jgi:hypothetical protein
MRHEAATDRAVEDGLAELLDLIGARGEGWQDAKREAGVIVEGVGIRIEVGEARSRQPVARRLRSTRAASSRSRGAIN